MTPSKFAELHPFGLTAAIWNLQMWPDEIEMALKACDYLVLFVTLKALKSDWVQREFQTALATDKKIISVFLEPLELSTVPDALQKIQYLRPYAYEDQAGAIQSLARALAEVREPFILPAMIPVREEPFIYGKPSAAQTLDLAEFWIGQHPVTVIEYHALQFPKFSILSRTIGLPVRRADGSSRLARTRTGHLRTWPHSPISARHTRCTG